MDLLTQTQTQEFIKKLEGYNSKNGVHHKNLHILEPRAFDIILNKIGSKKILELGRVSNSCEQVCKEYGIEYSFVYSESARNENRVMPKSWDWDIVAGYVDPRKSVYTALEALKLLQEGRTFALYQPYSFLESYKRYSLLFKTQPFNKMYLTSGRMLISRDGVFDWGENKQMTFNGAWYVWEGGVESEHPTIEWITDELYEKYFLQDEFTKKVFKYGDYCRAYKRPVKVKVDRGSGQILKNIKELTNI